MNFGGQQNNAGNAVRTGSSTGYERVVAHLIQEKCVDRRHTLFRAIVHILEQQDVFQVEDFSSNGLRGSTNINLISGDRIFLSLDEVTHLSGTVLWFHDRRFGMNFDAPLRVIPQKLQPFTDNKLTYPGLKPSAPRFRFRIFVCSVPHRAKVRDVSDLGMQIETDFALKTHQRLLVSLVNG